MQSVSLTIERNEMGLMTDVFKERIGTIGVPGKQIRTMIKMNGFETVLAAFSGNVQVDGMHYARYANVHIIESVDGVVTDRYFKHIHFFRNHDLLIFSGHNNGRIYGHGFMVVYSHTMKIDRIDFTKELVVWVEQVTTHSCHLMMKCMSKQTFVLRQMANLRDAIVQHAQPTDDDFKTAAVEENTMGFLNPQPNSAIEADYTFREWKWVLQSKEYLDVCVKRRAENGLHFLAMALSAQDQSEFEPL